MSSICMVCGGVDEETSMGRLRDARGVRAVLMRRGGSCERARSYAGCAPCTAKKMSRHGASAVLFSYSRHECHPRFNLFALPARGDGKRATVAIDALWDGMEIASESSVVETCNMQQFLKRGICSLVPSHCAVVHDTHRWSKTTTESRERARSPQSEKQNVLLCGLCGLPPLCGCFWSW
jgi:hypothetical protein